MASEKLYIPEQVTKEAVEEKLVPEVKKLTASIQDFFKLQEHQCPHCKRKFKC